uniref:Uncharacterized protein n=1 Tax=Arundo donax TaxID=35708 RepID=A0A0A9GTY5_ARUDO
MVGFDLYILGCLPLEGCLGHSHIRRNWERAKSIKVKHLINIKDNFLVLILASVSNISLVLAKSS